MIRTDQPCALGSGDVAAIVGKQRRLIDHLNKVLVNCPGPMWNEIEAAAQLASESLGIIEHAQKGGFSAPLTQERLEQITNPIEAAIQAESDLADTVETEATE